MKKLYLYYKDTGKSQTRKLFGEFFFKKKLILA